MWKSSSGTKDPIPVSVPHPLAVGGRGGDLRTATWPGLGHLTPVGVVGGGGLGRTKKPGGTGMSLFTLIFAGKLSTTTLLLTTVKWNSVPPIIPAVTPPLHCTENTLYRLRQLSISCWTLF